MDENSNTVSSIADEEVTNNEPQLSPIKTRSQSRKPSLAAQLERNQPDTDAINSESSILASVTQSPQTLGVVQLHSPLSESSPVSYAINKDPNSAEKHDDDDGDEDYHPELDEKKQTSKPNIKSVKIKVTIGKNNTSSKKSKSKEEEESNINSFETENKNNEATESLVSNSKKSKMALYYENKTDEIKIEIGVKTDIKLEPERIIINESKENKERLQENAKEDIKNDSATDEPKEKFLKKKVSIGKGKSQSSQKIFDNDSRPKEDPKISLQSKESEVNEVATKLSQKVSGQISKTPIKKINSIERTIAEAHSFLSKVTSPKTENSFVSKTQNHAKTSIKKSSQESAKKSKTSSKSKPKSAINSNKIKNPKTNSEKLIEGHTFLESLEERDKDGDEEESLPNKDKKRTKRKSEKKLKIMPQNLVEAEEFIDTVGKKAQEKDLAADSNKDEGKGSSFKKLMKIGAVAEIIEEGQALIGDSDEFRIGKRRRKNEVESTDDEGDKVEKKIKV